MSVMLAILLLLFGFSAVSRKQITAHEGGL
jgi:hypothetical protein